MFRYSFSILVSLRNCPGRFTSLTIFLLILLSGFDANASSPSKKEKSVYQKLKQIPPAAEKVLVGFYTQNIYELNPTSNTFYMDFYVWFKWKGKIDPTEKAEFMNGVEDWGMTKVPAYETPIVLADSSFYQLLRVEGRFRENFEFERYPLDEQKLGVVLENSVHDVNELVFVADTVESGYADDLSIPGWQFKDYKIASLFHPYKSNFGDPGSGLKQSNYSSLRFELCVSRPVNYLIWKLLFPLVMVLLASWGALLLDPTRVDSRIFLPITALLTIVFLQQSYSDALPAVSHLVLIDKLYVLAYVLIIGTTMETIYTAGILKADDPKSIERIKKIDHKFLLVKFLILALGIIVLFVF